MQIGQPWFRAWGTRRQSFLAFREAAERLVRETGAAYTSSAIAGARPPTLDYRAGQLIRYARYGTATLYARRAGGAALEPITRDELWSGHLTHDMKSWVTEAGIAYADLSLRPQDLGRVVRLVKQSLKDHDALLAWCLRHQHHHAPSPGD